MLRTSHFLLFAVGLAPLFAACAAEQDLGTRGGTQSALSAGQPCDCNYTDGCCATGLICDECEVAPGGGLTCSTSNSVPDKKCRAPRPETSICTSNAQCASGTCGPGPYEEDPRTVCTRAGSAGLAPGRCRESLDCPSGNICVDSHCKLARGERCDSSAECASNKCYGTSPLDYACL